jgi:hypothetical protein
MYNIDLDSLKKLADINNALNKIEVKGFENLGLLYSSMITLQSVIQKITDTNKNEPIIIDNSKG